MAITVSEIDPAENEPSTAATESALRLYVEAALPIAQRLYDLAERLQPGEWGCPRCGTIGRPAEQFPYGEGRDKGRHPDHRYCRTCGLDVDVYGALTYERHQYHKFAEERRRQLQEQARERRERRL